MPELEYPVTYPKPLKQRTETNKWSVYLFCDPEGRTYVGSTDQLIQDRWDNGLSYTHNKPLDTAIRETYGWESFGKYVLETGLSEKEADLKEIMYMSLYHADLLHGGYNRQSGGKKNVIVWGGNSKPVHQIDMVTGEIIHTWPSASFAAKMLHINDRHIREAAAGNRKSAGGFYWKYVDNSGNTENKK